MYKYFDEIPLGEDIETAYLTWKSEQHRLTPKYEIICSLVPLVKHYFVNVKEDDTIFKITCQHCNGFVTCFDRSGEILYITFLQNTYIYVLYFSSERLPKVEIFCNKIFRVQSKSRHLRMEKGNIEYLFTTT